MKLRRQLFVIPRSSVLAAVFMTRKTTVIALVLWPQLVIAKGTCLFLLLMWRTTNRFGRVPWVIKGVLTLRCIIAGPSIRPVITPHTINVLTNNPVHHIVKAFTRKVYPPYAPDV